MQMKAVQFAQYGSPEVLQVYDVTDPIPGPEDVLIQVKATTVNHLDLFQRDGSRPVPTLPFTPGLEAAGVVLKDSQGFHTGERVMTTRSIAAKGGGGYASEKATELRHFEDDLVVNHKEQNVGQVIRDAGGVNLVIALVSTTLQASIDACLNDGRIVLIGNLGGQQATVDTQTWRLKRVHVIGGGVYHTSI